MEILNQLEKTTTKTKRRVGRGIGSTNGGHTTGKGAKGDNVRGKTKLTFDGTKIKKGWIKRLPFLRGKHRTNKRNTIVSINLGQLEKWFKAGDTVDLNTLTKCAGLSLKDLNGRVKILADGNLTKKLTIKGLMVSESATKKIAALGGNIE